MAGARVRIRRAGIAGRFGRKWCGAEDEHRSEGGRKEGVGVAFFWFVWFGLVEFSASFLAFSVWGFTFQTPLPTRYGSTGQPNETNETPKPTYAQIFLDWAAQPNPLFFKPGPSTVHLHPSRE
jgi:hypothetical protein